METDVGLVTEETFSPHNETDDARAKATIESALEVLEDMAPDTGAYINEVSIQPSPYFVRLLRANQPNQPRPTSIRKTGSRPSGARTTTASSTSSAPSTRTKSSGVTPAWGMRGGRKSTDGFVGLGSYRSGVWVFCVMERRTQWTLLWYINGLYAACALLA